MGVLKRAQGGVRICTNATKRGNTDMGRLAYNITDAANTASVTEHAIKVAVREGALRTCNLNGRRVIMHDDLQAWVTDAPTLG